MKLIRYTAYAAEILLALTIQSVPYLLPTVFGEKALLLLPLALSFAVWEEELPSAVLGAVCGMAADLSFSGRVGFFSIFFVIACYILSRLMADYIKTTCLTAVLAAAAVIVLVLSVHCIIFVGDTGFFVRHYAVMILYTLAVMPLFYGLNKAVLARTKRSMV